MGKKKFDLEDRLVRFSGDIILFLNDFPNDKAASNLSGQLIRSSTSSALNFGEAQGSISTKDQIHKLSICLKELKESRVALKIIHYINYGKLDKREYLHIECEELIAIIASIINKKNEKLKCKYKGKFKLKKQLQLNLTLDT